MNGDRLPDLVTKRNGSLFLGIHEGSRFVGEILVFVNKGHGTFRPHRYKGFYGPSGLFVTDVNGGGRVDIAAEREERGVAVLLNRGGGSFEPRVDYRFPTIEGGTSMADLSSDDRPDLVGVALKTHALAVKLNTPGLCNVQDLRGLPLTAAKESLRRSNCRAGKVRRVRKKGAARGRVISQRPGFGAVRPGGAKVQLVVSRGRRG